MRGAAHALTIRSRSATVTAEGQVTYFNSDTAVQGRISQGGTNELSDGKETYQADAIAWVPLATTITGDDQVVVTGQNSHLNGTYDIQGIQHTPTHLRVMLSGVNV
jgi:hypothetical protein